MKIAFVGSCQVVGLREATRALLPDAHVEGHHIGAAHTAQQISEFVRHFDVVISQVQPHDKPNAALQPSALAGKVGKALFLPAFVFTGQHPDMTYIFSGGEILKGPLSDYHSSLIAGSFLLRLPPERVEALFNSFIFSRLGYFDAYEASYAAMIQQFDHASYDLRGWPERWLQTTGQFMHTINHPTVTVLAHLATESLKKAGIIDLDTPPPVGLKDNLAESFVAPIHPPLARRLGIPGSDIFLKKIGSSEDRKLELGEYIRLSYQLYESCNLASKMLDKIGRVRDQLKVLFYKS